MPADPRSVLREAATRLQRLGVASSRAEAEVLLAHVTGRPRGSLGSAAPVPDADVARLSALVERRATAPLQHLTGQAYFRHLTLTVGPGVFVPRPETEVLAGEAVEEARRLAAAGVEQPLVVDLCSGSGAVALAVATEVPGTRVLAAELSAEACTYARRNIATHASDVDLVEADITDLTARRPDLVGRVHVVTANPPYIPLGEFESVPADVREHDPPMALWSGDDGLDATRVVADVAADLLVDGGLLLSEHADVQGETAPAVLATTGAWSHVSDRRDLAGRPRHVSARRCARGATHLGQ